MRKKQIEDYPDYDIYDDGKVFSRKSNKFLKSCKNDSGYLTVNLYKGDIKSRRSCAVYALVAEYFIDNPNNYSDVNHKDHNKENNDYRNLEWCTKSYNTNYTYEYNVHRKQRPVICIDNDTIYRSASEAERQLNCDHRMICACCKGKRKSHKGLHFKYYNGGI